MLDCSAMNLLDEIEEAEAHRDKHLKVIDELQLGYLGAYYREDCLPDFPNPENHAFEFVSLTLPKLVFDNPIVTISSRNPRTPEEVASAIEFAVNQWIKDERFHDEVEMAVFDAMFGYGVMLTTLDDIEEREVEEEDLRRMLPSARHLERHLFFRDPTATVTKKPRFAGHVWVRDKEDVLKMEGILADAVDTVTTDGELDRLRRPNGTDSPPRDEIVAYEIWVPENNDYCDGDKNCHGTIFTLAVGQVISDGGAKRGRKAEFIREPRPYYGPKWGPYVMFGFYPVSNQCFPLSPLAVTAEQAEELNTHATAVAEAMARMKSFGAVDATSDVLLQAVKKSPDGTLLAIPELGKNGLLTIEIPGASKEQLGALEILRERLDRISGMSDAYRGNTNPDVTATADNIAYQGVSIRTDYLKKRVKLCTSRVLDTVAWLMFYTHNVVIPLGRDAAQQFGMNQPAYLGGTGDDDDSSYDHLCLDIEPMSMERVDEHTLKTTVLEVMAIIVQLAQEMPNMPWLNWRVLLDQLARLHNFRWLKEVINDQLFKTFMAESLQAQSSAQQTDLALKRAELQIKAAQAAREEKIGQSLSYKDVPEDIKRQMEQAAGYRPSSMPLTAASHVTNQLALHQQSVDQVHDRQSQGAQQQHERKQSVLAGLLKSASEKRSPQKRKAS